MSDSPQSTSSTSSSEAPPDSPPPAWCIEHATGATGVPFAIIRTLYRSLFPVRFWRELDGAHSIRPRRLIAYAITLGLILYLVFAITLGFAALRVWPHLEVGEQYVVETPAGVIARQAALMPLSNRPPGLVRPAPKQDMKGAPVVALRSPRQVFFETFLENPPVQSALLFIAAMTILSPLALTGLARMTGGLDPPSGTGPVGHHVARIVIYSLGPMAIAAGFIIATAPGIYGRYNGFPVWHYDRLELLLVPSSGAFLACWWGAASGSYLGLRAGWAPGVGAVVIALAGALAIAMI